MASTYSLDPNDPNLLRVQLESGQVVPMAAHLAPQLQASGIMMQQGPGGVGPLASDGGGGAGNEPETLDADNGFAPLNEGSGGAPGQVPSSAGNSTQTSTYETDPQQGAYVAPQATVHGSAPTQELPAPAAQPQGSGWGATQGKSIMTGRSVSGGGGISEENKQGLSSAYDSQKAALQGHHDKLAEQKEQLRADTIIELAKQDAQLEEARNRRVALNKKLDDAEAQRREKQAKAEAAAVDPERWFRDRPTWAKALTGIATAISAASQRYIEGLQGQSSQPLRGVEIIRQAWQDDVANQKLLFEQAKDETDLADNRYQEMLRLYGTPEDAEKALVAQDMALTQKWLEAQAQEVQDTETLEGIKGLIAGLEVEKQSEIAKLAASHNSSVSESFTYVPPQMTYDGVPVDPKDEQGRRVRMPDGSPAWANTEADAKTANDFLSKAQFLKSGLARIEKLVAAGDRAGAEAVVQDLARTYNPMKGQGAMGQEESVSVIDNTMGNPGALFDLTGKGVRARAALGKSLRDLEDRVIGQYLSSDPRGLKPIKRGATVE